MSMIISCWLCRHRANFVDEATFCKTLQIVEGRLYKSNLKVGWDLKNCAYRTHQDLLSTLIVVSDFIIH